MSLKNVDLTIHAKTAVEIPRKYIGELSEKHEAKGILPELSGGIDSTLIFRHQIGFLRNFPEKIYAHKYKKGTAQQHMQGIFPEINFRHQNR